MSRGAHAAHANRSARNARNARNTRTRRQPQQTWNVPAPNTGDGGRADGYGTRATFAAPRLTFLNALRAEICKASSLKSTYVLLIINALLLPVGSALMAWAMAFLMSLDPATGTTTDDPQPVAESYMWGSASAFVPTCLLVTGILGVMAVTVEYSSSTIQSSLTANPRRVMFLNAKTLVTAALAFVSSLVGLLLAWAAAYALLSPVGMTPLADGEHALPWVSILGGALLLTAMAVLGVGLGGVCRSTMGGVFALVGLLIIVPSALSMASLAGDRFAWLQSVARCLPDQAVGNVLTAGVDVAVSSSSTNVSVDVEAMNTAAGSAAGASAGSVTAAGSAVASDPSGLFDPTWWQSGLIVLAWMTVAYIIGVMAVRHSDVK
ncbi:ABC transporter permease [Bifidobacterium pullorum]|uniref:ABC transporter permease n=1 Tax=Bifidobacterium pullorum TaxID=78448 RepID=A0A7V8HQ06_9BIFI|nr:ABC transporter permease [Bifidobacterium pullorum]